MIDRAKYRLLRKIVQARLTEQAGRDFIAVRQNDFLCPELTKHELKQAWPYIVRELRLVDDGTHTETWTLAGRGFRDAYVDSGKLVERYLERQE